MKSLTIQSPRRGQSFTEWQQEWADTLIGRETFEAASAHGCGYSATTLELPAEWVADYHATANHATPFVVYSWGTPVAWVDALGRWVVPSVKFTISTTRTQNRVRSTLDYMGRGYRETIPAA